jgi:outer membrane protein TolC
MAASLVPASMGSAVDQITGSGTVVRSGWGTAYTNALAGAGLRWLLFDFGARDHRNRAALSEQLAANMRFNAAHQKVVFAVTEAYYHLQASRRREAAARISQESAADVLKAAEARFAQGLLTEPELAEVRAAHAQADFDLVTARSQVEVARVDLATAAGLPPGLPFRTPDADFSRLTAALDQPLDSHIRTALRQRPDLLAQVSAVQAAEARLREARAARLPTLALDAVAQYNRFSPTGNNSDAFTDISETFTNTGGFLTVQWPLFAGFAKDNAERLAETAREAAREELHLLREKTIAEVWKSYVRAKNAVAGRQAATALESAATDSYQATLAGFDRGITPIQEVLKARAARAQAAALSANADAAIAESLTTLALSSGSL